MGLFGYNRKTFDKNSELMKEKLQAICDSLPAKKATYNHITSLIRKIDTIKYRTISRKYKEVDAVIFELIDKMERDANDRKYISLFARADNLERELDKSRKSGKHGLSEEERNAREVYAVSQQEIYDIVENLDGVYKQKDAIQKAVGAEQRNPNLVLLAKLEEESAELNAKEKELRRMYSYCSHKRAQANMLIDEFYKYSSVKGCIGSSKIPEYRELRLNYREILMEDSEIIEKEYEEYRKSVILSQFEQEFKQEMQEIGVSIEHLKRLLYENG